MESVIESMIELRQVTYSVPTDEEDGDAGRNGARKGARRKRVVPKLRHKPGRRTILEDVSFVVPERRLTCIMGVSGSGKTTLLRLMAGLLRPDSGQILIDGQNIVGMNEWQLNQVRRKMGFVFQYGALFDSLTIAENVGFGLIQQRRPWAEVMAVVAQRLQDVGLPDIEERLPSELSGGMRKRVAMARALATSPKVVLYDEPTSGLDPVMARVIDDLIVNLRDQGGTTNVVVSHHLTSILRIADHILMLHDGRIVIEGPPAEVRQSDSPIVRQFLEGRADGPITVV